MVLPQSEFPVSSGEFKSYPPEASEYGPQTRKCSLDSMSHNIKAAFSVVKTEAGKYRVDVAQTESRSDLSAWVRDTLPCEYNDGGSVMKQIDLPGLPTGSVSLEVGNEAYVAAGYSRGLLVTASVWRRNATLNTPAGNAPPEGAKSDVVKMFNAQVDRIENY